MTEPRAAHERQALEAALRQAQRAVAEAEERAEKFQAITIALAEAGTVAAVSELVITAGAAALGRAGGTLSLVTADGQALALAASVRMPEVAHEAFQYLPLDPRLPARTAAVVALRTKQPLWFSSNAELQRNYPELAEARAQAQLEASAVVPLLLGERALGVVVFAFNDVRSFSAAERAFFLALGRQGAQALERLRLYQAERDLRLHEQQARAEAEISRLRLAFVVELSSTLSATLNYDSLMERLAYLLVPELADYAAIYTLRADQRIVNVATAHVVPEKQARLQALHAQVHLQLDTPHSLIAQVMRTGQPLFDPAFDWQQQYEQAPAADQAYLAALQPKAHMILPLVARGHALGVVVLTVSEGPRTLTLSDLRLAEDVARRVALMADNARLLQQAQRLNAQLEERMQAQSAELLQSENRFHVLVDSVQDYAIFLLDPAGRVVSWNTGAARIKGYQAAEIIGQHFSVFYTPEEAAQGVPERSLRRAREAGHVEAEGWRVRQNGTRFWANVVITPVRDELGTLLGYAKVTRDLTERKRIEDELQASQRQLRQEIAARQQVQQQLEQAREAERARIAREVHDELGGALTGIKMGLRRMRTLDRLPPQAPEQIDELSTEIDNTVQIVRRIAQDLRPAVLDDFGLLAALEWQFEEFKKRSGLETAWRCTLEDVTLPSEAAIACFRIFQEALTNIARHARASRVEVDIYQAQGQLVVGIADNGQGLPADRAVPPGHLGLVGMRERAVNLAAQLEITSEPGHGTTVTLRVPLPAEAGEAGEASPGASGDSEKS